MPWETLLLSVILYVVIPLAAGYVTRKKLDRSNDHSRIAAFTNRIKPFSVMGLLATVVLLFGFQAQTILDKPLVIALIAVPLLIQSYGIFAVAYGWAYIWRIPFVVGVLVEVPVMLSLVYFANRTRKMFPA